MSSSASPQFSRTIIYISVGMVLLLIVVTLVGTRIISDRMGNQPVAMSELPAPLADSADCAQLVDSLPDRLLGHDRAEIADPAPAGTAAWQSSSIERITLRCGVDLPFQYTDYAVTEEIGGTRWLRVDDMTPDSDMATWYTVDREPIVAITADGSALGRADEPVSDLSEQIQALPTAEHEPGAAPLSELEAATGDTTRECGELSRALPNQLADTWTRLVDPEKVPDDTAVWTAPGVEPIVVRCGVAPPPNYQAGAQLTQIDDIPWFEDEHLVTGSTASYWYALGRATDIAVSVPQTAAGEALPELGRIIAEATAEQPGDVD